MNLFLKQFINSLTTFQHGKVADILGHLAVSKGELQTVADELSALGQFYPFTVNAETPFGIISAGDMLKKFQDVAILMNAMYRSSNLVSTLLDSHASTLSSDIKAIEDELNTAQKLLDNYSFLLADGGTFPYSYLEPFTDALGQDAFAFDVPDRAAQVFVGEELSLVETDENSLTLSPLPFAGLSLNAQVLRSNVTAYTYRDTGIQNAVNQRTTTGWQLTVLAPTIVTSSVPQADGVIGAQVVTEFTLSSPSPSARLKLVPLIDQPLDVLQIILYKSPTDNIGVSILAEPITLEKPTSIFFPAQTVSRFVLVLSQATYTRVAGPSSNGEEAYRQLYASILAKRGQEGFNALNDKEILALVKKIRTYLNETQFGVASPQVEIPYSSFNPNYGPLSLEENLADINNRKFSNSWEVTDPQEAQILQIFTQIFPDWHLLFTQWGRQPGDLDRAFSTQSVSSDGSQVVTASPVPPGYRYQYNIGLQNVSIGMDVPMFKGAFVSKPLPSTGTIGELRLKVAEDNYRLPNTDRVSPWLTATEYSVSNQSSPQDESDWSPILPVGMNQVTAELLFPDTNGNCTLRFPVDTSQTIFVYRNGYSVNNFTTFTDATGNVSGITINDPVAANAFYTADYTPLGDFTTISLSYDNLPLVSAYDGNGAGEGFLATGNRNMVSLRYAPYVDPVKVAASSYFAQLGLFPYQPMRVVFSNGSTATNVTDYTKASSPQLTQTTGYYYLQSGNSIIFNQAVTQSFRVYYQYPQSNVRIRAVLRATSKNFVSPKVTSLHVKAKVAQSGS